MTKKEGPQCGPSFNEKLFCYPNIYVLQGNERNKSYHLSLRF